MHELLHHCNRCRQSFESYCGSDLSQDTRTALHIAIIIEMWIAWLHLKTYERKCVMENKERLDILETD